jgi:hypothetical protein
MPAPTGLALMCTALAEYDRAGAVNPVEPLTPPLLDALVRLCVSFVSRIVVPFHLDNNDHKPTPSYLICGVLFFFAQRNMNQLHIPLLRKNLPDHRHVQMLEPPFMLKRLTWARRYAQAAFLNSARAAANSST